MAGAAKTDTTGGLGLEDVVGYNLKRVYMIFQSDLRDRLARDDLAPRSYSALALAVQTPDITQSELARRLGIERSGLVAIVDHLEDLGFLKRVPVPGDRRVQALAPTEKGRALFLEISTEITRQEDRILSVLTDEDRSALIRILKTLRAQNETS